eukprot:COSAG01_NODE_13704_length_1546_cov_1.243262_3_plen_55_part_01
MHSFTSQHSTAFHSARAGLLAAVRQGTGSAHSKGRASTEGEEGGRGGGSDANRRT